MSRLTEVIVDDIGADDQVELAHALACDVLGGDPEKSVSQLDLQAAQVLASLAIATELHSIAYSLSALVASS